MLEWIKVNLFKFGFFVSILGNICLIVVLIGKGILIVNNTTSNSQSISNSYSSSAALNQTLVYDTYRLQGKWTIKEKKFFKHQEVVEFYNTLNPIEIMFLKESYQYGEGWFITYPEISDVKLKDTKDSGVKTETSTKVIK